MVPKITQVSLSSPSHPCMKKTRWIYDVLSFRGEDTRFSSSIWCLDEVVKILECMWIHLRLGNRQGNLKKHLINMKMLPGTTEKRFMLCDELDSRNCNIEEESISSDLGCLSSLRLLNPSGNNFPTLHASFRGVSELERLYMDNCKRLDPLVGVFHKRQASSGGGIRRKNHGPVNLLACNCCLPIVKCSPKTRNGP
ncbi:hypothetical protein Peur_027045 [Populus x canadensis]